MIKQREWIIEPDGRRRIHLIDTYSASCHPSYYSLDGSLYSLYRYTGLDSAGAPPEILPAYKLLHGRGATGGSRRAETVKIIERCEVTGGSRRGETVKVLRGCEAVNRSQRGEKSKAMLVGSLRKPKTK